MSDRSWRGAAAVGAGALVLAMLRGAGWLTLWCVPVAAFLVAYAALGGRTISAVTWLRRFGGFEVFLVLYAISYVQYQRDIARHPHYLWSDINFGSHLEAAAVGGRFGNGLARHAELFIGGFLIVWLLVISQLRRAPLSAFGPALILNAWLVLLAGRALIQPIKGAPAGVYEGGSSDNLGVAGVAVLGGLAALRLIVALRPVAPRLAQAQAWLTMAFAAAALSLLLRFIAANGLTQLRLAGLGLLVAIAAVAALRLAAVRGTPVAPQAMPAALVGCLLAAALLTPAAVDNCGGSAADGIALSACNTAYGSPRPV